MSNIAVQGGATGTGTVSLVAPSTSTNRTLTLPDSTGTIAAASSGTPDATTFLRGDGAWATAGSPPGTVDLLQEDTITSSGSWTKAAGFDADDTVMVFLFGGGGSGGAVRVNTESGGAVGGIAGSTLVLTGRYGDVPTSSFTLTLGAGGAGVTRTTDGTQDGLFGGNSILEDASHYFSALGSAGGIARNEFATSRISTFNSASNWSSNTFQGFSPGRLVTTVGADEASTMARSQGTTIATFNGNAGVNFNTGTLPVGDLAPAGQLVSSGGGAGRAGATNQTVFNAVTAALLYNHGGAGSGTANGVSATGFGGGGGGCVRQSTTATSGAGGSGAMIVRYYSGRVSPLQVVFGSST